MELTSQERMPIDIVPLPEQKPKKYNTLEDWFAAEDVPDAKKYKMIWTIKDFITFNGITKMDLCAALKWLAENTLHEEPVEKESTKILKFKSGSKENNV
ncbi:MAG: hypothetical protein MJZ81_07815 [Bacteroidales bacterium]|nr:hypothetical protein [Bacteroidales bacterium]